jgi:lambda repressor-like predicted transcriptional regulator
MYEKLKEHIESRGYTISRLALECRISPSNLHQALKGKRQVYPKWRQSICQILEVNEEEIFPPYVKGGL